MHSVLTEMRDRSQLTMTDPDANDEATRTDLIDLIRDDATREQRQNGDKLGSDIIRHGDAAGDRSERETRGRVLAVLPPAVRRDDTGEGEESMRDAAVDAGWGERFRGSGAESLTHVWGKLALARRRQARQHPWFRGTYEFERTVADWVADCLITDPAPCAWIEFVVSADQQYRAKTRAALRFGYPIYWVFREGADAARRAARDALAPHLEDDVSFGTFNPQQDTIRLGDAVTFETYRVPVESPTAFQYSEVLGYRAGAADVPLTQLGYDFGWVRIGDVPRRVYAAPNERKAWVIPPSHPGKTEYLVRLDDEESWVVRRIVAGDVERVGPIPSTSTYERRLYQALPPRKE